MADILRCTIFEGDDWFTEFNRNLQSVAWAFRSTVSTATNYSPGNLAFKHDMMIQMRWTVNWELVKQKRENEHSSLTQEKIASVYITNIK